MGMGVSVVGGAGEPGPSPGLGCPHLFSPAGGSAQGLGAAGAVSRAGAGRDPLSAGGFSALRAGYLTGAFKPKGLSGSASF